VNLAVNPLIDVNEEHIGSMLPWTSKPETPANITVTILRSPSGAARDVRILSARCLGV